MLNGPHLTIPFLSGLPAGTMLRDVQAHYACGGQWYARTRWPQATPAQMIDEVRLQRHFAPVLTWRCAEIRLPPTRRGTGPVPKGASYATRLTHDRSLGQPQR
jgi:hypothetical protein